MKPKTREQLTFCVNVQVLQRMDSPIHSTITTAMQFEVANNIFMQNYHFILSQIKKKQSTNK